ncbi:hypothetical protein HanXRQr2_Chr14g0652581 [Helianthus annuus]|uniref:Uncharacterized protein n=1 Tax=Helianthus annuus TaxID=4232 RepID=A0A251SIQ0_HELAN|nr:hypothetical protein HanXRQr2_Chr14g0652581 [Helianthus annuus]KAJ0841036.1 hypothetical protein HanPSC8_Chr14g0625821 [Helianthus annuus]
MIKSFFKIKRSSSLSVHNNLAYIAFQAKRPYTYHFLWRVSSFNDKQRMAHEKS